MKDRTNSFETSRSIVGFTIIRHGLAMMIPLILTGGIAFAIANLPISSYQTLIDGSLYKAILSVIHSATFGIFSIAMLVSMSASYCMEKNMPLDHSILYVLISLCAFTAQTIDIHGNISMEMLGVKGCFFAITTALICCALLDLLRNLPVIYMRSSTFGMSRITAISISLFVSAAIVISLFGIVNQSLLRIFHVSSLFELITNFNCAIVTGIHNEFGQGLIYTFLLHLLWSFGFHGSHILESVATSSFAVGQAGPVFSKSFFDIYVVMGGCGTTFCVLISLLLFFRKAQANKLAKISIFTVIFNLNEILTFGIPILLNPPMMIPFILTPITCYVIAYGATAFGLVPPVTQEVVWSTPILFNAYLGTGSIRGPILQIVLLIIGVAIYTPFIRISLRIHEKCAKDQLGDVITLLQHIEEQSETIDLLAQSNRHGQISRVLRHDLKCAIKRKELVMLFQPQMDNDGKCIGAEALLRWKHPFYGYIYPPLIIYLAKHGGLLEDLEKLIVDQTVEAIREIRTNCGDDFKISINLTTKSFNWEIEKYIEEALEKEGINPHLLWIEITEQDILTDNSVATEKIKLLKDKGHVMMIDDFGMGHTSIIYLQSCNFGVVKIDGSLVKNILKDETNQEIVASIISLSKKLGIKVVAEFIETEEQRNKLRELGCDWYQGYLYSPAIPLSEFIAYLNDHK